LRIALKTIDIFSSALSPIEMERKRNLPEDFYLTNEELLRQFQETLEGIRAQRDRYKQKRRNYSRHSCIYRHYSDRLTDLCNTIVGLEHNIRIYQIRTTGLIIASTSTRSGRIVRHVARFQDEEFLSGSNNKHTKGRRVDVGESTER